VTDQEKAAQELLFARIDAQGLTIVLSSLMVEYAKGVGGDYQIALARVRAILERSLSKLKLEGVTIAGAKRDLPAKPKNA
jgi:hypothetical protein